MMSWDRIAQTQTPLLSALQQCATRSTAPFHTPGHKQGQGIDAELAALLGDRVFRADLPELPELDNLFAPSGVIQAAQTLAAEVFGAEHTWFLSNGSTSGILAAMLATCGPGDKMILPRNVHQSAISGLVLSGAIPVFVQPEWDPSLDLAHCPTPTAIAQALEQHPEAKAVLIVSPTYYGVCADVAAIAQVCHAHSIPLLVDEAHGAHFGFHPALPMAALRAGADVAVQSTHKVLSAFTQAAMIHLQGARVNRDRLTKALALVQSTSPNYLLLASLDATRRQMALTGHDLMTHALQMADQARSRLATIPGLSLLSPPQPRRPGCFDFDRTRLTVTVAGLGVDGFTADTWLTQHWGVVAELPTLRQLTFLISLGTTPTDIDRLVQGLTQLAAEHSLKATLATGEPISLNTLDEPQTFSLDALAQDRPVAALSPRDAFFAAQETRPIQDAIGQISAELICPYPPGIPVLVPGEQITSAAIARLQHLLAVGGVLSGCADPTLNTVRVVALG